MEYKKILPNQYSNVIQHLRDNFFADEPLNNAANLCQRGEKNIELELHSILTLEDNLSLMAISQNQDIAGVVLNGILRPGDIETSSKKLENCDDENFKKIFNLLNEENRRLDIFTKFNVDKIFDIRILSVDSRFRGMGLARELITKSENIAKDNNFQIIKADATGIYSQRILLSLDYKVLSTFQYENYKDISGRPIFEVKQPHNELKIVYKTIN